MQYSDFPTKNPKSAKLAKLMLIEQKKMPSRPHLNLPSDYVNLPIYQTANITWERGNPYHKALAYGPTLDSSIVTSVSGFWKTIFFASSKIEPNVRKLTVAHRPAGHGLPTTVLADGPTQCCQVGTLEVIFGILHFF